MSTLKNLRKELAKFEQANQKSSSPKYFFRGQNSIYPSIKSTFARVPENGADIGQIFTVFRYAKQICQGLRGYSIDHVDGLAVLQHYGWPTPLVDVTGTLEVAFAFALMGASPSREAVIYVIDAKAIGADTLVIEHSFLTHELLDGGLRHRWLRQDGFALTTESWRAVPDARSFDLLGHNLKGAVTEYRFFPGASDQAQIGDLLSLDGDPIPEHLKSILRIFCRNTFGEHITPKVQQIIGNIGSC